MGVMRYSQSTDRHDVGICALSPIRFPTDEFQYGNSLVLIAQLEAKIESTHKLCIVSKVWVKLNKMIQLHSAHPTYPYRLSVVSVSVCRMCSDRDEHVAHTHTEWPPANCLRFRCLARIFRFYRICWPWKHLHIAQDNLVYFYFSFSLIEIY